MVSEFETWILEEEGVLGGARSNSLADTERRNTVSRAIGWTEGFLNHLY